MHQRRVVAARRRRARAGPRARRRRRPAAPAPGPRPVTSTGLNRPAARSSARSSTASSRWATRPNSRPTSASGAALAGRPATTAVARRPSAEASLGRGGDAQQVGHRVRTRACLGELAFELSLPRDRRADESDVEPEAGTRDLGRGVPPTCHGRGRPGADGTDEVAVLHVVAQLGRGKQEGRGGRQASPLALGDLRALQPAQHARSGSTTPSSPATAGRCASTSADSTRPS